MPPNASAAPASSRFSETDASTGCVKVLGRVHAIMKQPGTAGRAAPREYSDGDSPTTDENSRLNVPRLVNPTDRHTSVTSTSVVRSRNIARSMRRRWR